MLKTELTSEKRYKVGQHVMYVDYDTDEKSLGVIVSNNEPVTHDFNYLVQFMEDDKPHAFTHLGIKMMVEDYNEFVRNNS